MGFETVRRGGVEQVKCNQILAGRVGWVSSVKIQFLCIASVRKDVSLELLLGVHELFSFRVFAGFGKPFSSISSWESRNGSA